MTGRILRSILAVAVAVLAASLAVITGFLYQHFGSVQQSQLKDGLSFAAVAVERLGADYLEGLDSDRYRLTWVGSDGAVLFDSHADAAAMENHADREEVREALAAGAGSSVRDSSTLLQQTVYEAVRLDDGSVLRISAGRDTALALVVGMARPMAAVLLGAVALSALLARRMARRVVEPLNGLDLDRPLENDAYEEISPLLRRIDAQRREIELRAEALRRKQDEFEQITVSMREALVLLDGSDRVVSMNPAAKELFGVGGPCRGRDFLSIDRGQDVRRAVQEAKERGRSAFHARRNGREHQFDLALVGSGGSARGLAILAFDVTEQANAERRRREFTANVSHELKTPLQSIIGSAELLEGGVVRPEDAPRFLRCIRREAGRLVALVEDVIRLSQLDEGAEMPREDVSLRALADEAAETLADAAGLKGVSVEVSGDEGAMRGVRGLLYEVVFNLCDNAVKYNRPGGFVGVRVSEEPGAVRVSVSDGGVGIAPEHRDKVFERFYRVDKSHSRESGGTGLGLSIVKHAVQYHGGQIFMESELGRGTTVSVLFPTERL